MTRVLDLLRGLVTGVLGALLGAAGLLIFYAAGSGLVVSMDNDPPPIVSGLYPVERAPSGLTFAWSGESLRLGLAGLDRQHAWTFRARFSAPRPTPEPPDVTIEIDGVTLARVRGTPEFQDVSVTLPTFTGERRGAQIIVRASNTFSPGATDPRTLGLMVDDLRIERPAHGVPIVPRHAIWSAGLGGAIFGALFGLIGLTAGTAVLAVVALGAGQAAVLAAGAAPYTRYATRIGSMAASIALGTIVIVWIVERLQGERVPGQPFHGRRLRNTARFVAAFSAGALFLKLLVLFHPGMPVGDALFQAHRFEWVRDGRWLFTSHAPGGYEFPYAIGLYVAALPFDTLVHGTFGFMALLRVMVAATDTAAGVLLYPMIVRSAVFDEKRSRLAGAIAVALFHLIPLNFQVQTVGNLTNAFGQSLFVVSLAALVLTPAAGRRGGAGLIALGVAASAAMLSHTSTFVLALPILLLAAHAFFWHGTPAVSSRALRVLMVTVAAALVAVVLYYAHFGSTYAAQIARISGELGQPAELSDPGGRSVAQRAAAVPYYLNEYYGWPALVLAGVGAGALTRRRDALTMTLWAWVGGACLFLLLGVVTPVDFRYYLAAFPAVAILAGLGGARWWNAGPPRRAAAAVLMAAALVIGVGRWIGPLR